MIHCKFFFLFSIPILPLLKAVRLLLQILRRSRLLLLLPLTIPKTDAHNPTKRKKNAKGNAESPNGFHLIARGLTGTCPGEVVDLTHVQADRVDER